MAPKYNTRSAAVKRIMQEMREMADTSDPNQQFAAEALEDDIFEWQFVLRGPSNTDFEGGLYHGRVLLPPEYPFKPPSFIMLTPSGRFETNVKVCLSISSHHPEHWQPSWSIRTALTALIAFFPTDGKGAVGAMNSDSATRRALAVESRTNIPAASSAARAQVMRKLHSRMTGAAAEQSPDACPSAACQAQATPCLRAKADAVQQEPRHCGDNPCGAAHCEKRASGVGAADPVPGQNLQERPQRGRLASYLRALDDLVIAVVVSLVALIAYRFV